MENTKAFKHYHDSQHGWIKVDVNTLVELGIYSDITEYSYLSKCGSYVFLEEDCDYNAFKKAYLAKYSVEPLIIEQPEARRSFIRSLARFKKVA